MKKGIADIICQALIGAMILGLVVVASFIPVAIGRSIWKDVSQIYMERQLASTWEEFRSVIGIDPYTGELSRKKDVEKVLKHRDDIIAEHSSFDSKVYWGMTYINARDGERLERHDTFLWKPWRLVPSSVLWCGALLLSAFMLARIVRWAWRKADPEKMTKLFGLTPRPGHK